MIAHFAATLPQVTNELFARFELSASRLIAIEVANQTNSERNVVEIIAVDVATVDLPSPTVAYFDLAVAGRRSVADHKMISKPVLHSANMTMIIIEHRRVPLTRAAVVHHNELPASTRDRRAIDLCADRRAEVAVTASAAAWPAAAKNTGPKASRFFVTIFFDRQLFRLLGWSIS